MSFRGRPVPTSRAVWLLALGLVPALLAVLSGRLWVIAAALDLALVLLVAVDFLRAPARLAATRTIAPVISSGVENRVAWTLASPETVRGELRDEVPAGVWTSGHRLPFAIEAGGECQVEYRLKPFARGDLALGELHVRLRGPLGLASRELSLPARETVRVFPDLTSLSREALQLARADDAPSERVVRRASEGTEFDSLREYREGDDYRQIDWKSTARRAKAMVRIQRPEQNQAVLLLLDCGRHMAGKLHERRKLDHAVDAALRLAKVSLDEGDLVGVTAFSTEVRAHLPPKKGHDHLRALTHALYRVDAALEESDYGRALDATFARHHRRSLAVVFTDLSDPETSAQLVKRLLALRPRHLPLVASLLDEELEAAARLEPQTTEQAYVRRTAARLAEDHRRTVAALRNAGALVVRESAARFGAATVNAYLRVKAKGLL